MQLIEKPWGSRLVIEINDRYMVKEADHVEGHRCSVQYHNVKRETIYVLQRPVAHLQRRAGGAAGFAHLRRR